MKLLQDIDISAEEIWQNYFVNSSRLSISLKCKQELNDEMSKGRPFTSSVFSKAENEIFAKINTGHVGTRLGSLHKLLFISK